MNSIIKKIKDRASTQDATVVLPESEDPRVLRAAAQLIEQQICCVILLGDASEIKQKAYHEQISLDWQECNLEICDPAVDSRLTDYAQHLWQRRKHKGMSLKEARKLAEQPLWFAALMMAHDDAQGGVAGSIATTADVIRAGIYCLGLEEGVQTVSSTFLMAFDDGRTYTYADCGVVPYPTVDQLVDITQSAARTHQQLTQDTPRVAMLSFSTKGSAQHQRVDLVTDALQKVRELDDSLNIDGELQFDAAIDPAVAQRKAPDSNVAGRANVFIFPNLDAGNIGYKITERLAGAQATGPILQGLARPLMDLSRGCGVEDIVTAASVSLLLGSNR
jgi:phosphate acetyltransferase